MSRLRQTSKRRRRSRRSVGLSTIFLVLCVLSLVIALSNWRAIGESAGYRGTEITSDELNEKFLEYVKNGVQIDRILKYVMDVTGDGKDESLLILIEALPYHHNKLVIVDAAMTPVWERNVWTSREVLFERIREDLPPVFYYIKQRLTGSGATSDEWEFMLYLDGGPQLILDASSYRSGANPVFVDMNSDGAKELYFKGGSCRMGSVPMVYAWENEERKMVRANRRFPGFYQPLIDAEMRELERAADWADVVQSCARIANLMSLRGGKQDVAEFLAVMDRKVDLLIESGGRVRTVGWGGTGNEFRNKIHQGLELPQIPDGWSVAPPF